MDAEWLRMMVEHCDEFRFNRERHADAPQRAAEKKAEMMKKEEAKEEANKEGERQQKPAKKSHFVPKKTEKASGQFEKTIKRLENHYKPK
jgi:hypothetical protein